MLYQLTFYESTIPNSTSGSSQAGAVDEESFMSAFEEVKRVNIYSGRALAEELSKIRETLSKSSNDWKVSQSELYQLNFNYVI